MYESASPEPVEMEQIQPISRTYQYRKVMKPMLERKRRARINRCLDELKELMVSALQSEGENVSKLEKADILELTVQHLHKLKKQRRLAASPLAETDRFRAGYTSCAAEVSKCLASTPGVDVQLGTKLMTHLGHRLVELDNRTGPLTVRVSSAASTSSEDSRSPSTSPSPLYPMPLTPASSRNSDSPGPEYSGGLLKVADPEASLWRPW